MIRFKKIEGNLKNKIPDLVQILKKDKRINTLYLFGSYSKNEVKPLSDVDIGVLLKKDIPSPKYWSIRIDLLSRIVHILGTEEVDLVILNEAPFSLGYSILKDGKILFSQNEKERQVFHEKMVLKYLDTQHLREEIFFHLRERLKNGRFGNDKGKYKKDFENARRIFGEITANC